MARPPAPPRRSADGRRAARAWGGGVRFSGFVAIMIGLAILAVFVLVPTIGIYVDQRQQVRALQSAVETGADQVAELEAERERWQDPAYITTQARERLYYIRPGEVVYLVDNDLAASDVPREQAPVSTDVEETRADWMSQLVGSVVGAGLARTAVPAVTG